MKRLIARAGLVLAAAFALLAGSALPASASRIWDTLNCGDPESCLCVKVGTYELVCGFGAAEIEIRD